MKEKIKKYLKEGVIFIVTLTIALNAVSYYRSLDLNKDSLNIKSSGKINLPEQNITEREINQVLQTAYNNASIPFDYEIIHTIPKNFIVNNESVLNPLNINANSLEVQANVIAVRKNLLSNLRNMFARLNLNNLNFVLNSYSTIFALTDSIQRKNGLAVINIGAETSEILFFKDNSYIYNNFLPVGSRNITNDLALMLNISVEVADNIKFKYGNLLKDYKNLEHSQNVLKLESVNETLNLSNIQTIVHARVEETLIFLRKKLKDSASINELNSGILITGGLANLKGVKELAQKVFDGIPISLAAPTNLQNRFVNLEEYILSSTVGALNYIVNFDNRYELDSNKKLLSFINEEIKHKNSTKNEEQSKKEDLKLTPLKQEPQPKINILYKKLFEWF